MAVLIFFIIFFAIIIGSLLIPSRNQQRQQQQGGFINSTVANYVSDVNLTEVDYYKDISTEPTLPQSVKDRIKENASLPWSSTLSVNDWLLVKKLGLKPIGSVMGTCFYQNRFGESYYENITQTTMLHTIENAVYSVCDLALKRLQKQAELMGAHAVIGVRMKTPSNHLFHHKAECTFVGTAVVIEGMPKPKQPILCTTSVTEFAKLLEVGAMPVGLSMGVCVYYQKNVYLGRSFNGNKEDYALTRDMKTLRLKAMQEVTGRTRDLAGNGFLCKHTHFFMEILNGHDRNEQKTLDCLMHFIVLGTAIEANHPIELPKFKLAVSLN